eukprot:CAMPEP_0194353890 /NCGR_PEP_ID=MMETSP0174-20130528/2099_1 /TAXON_ID=216777 /ORGANISM="Proboscia alata, Strain PI-D3" /LENGTH=598 /DNA_ID=CAMNT_0039122591 /DNA_START=101 /DNA_END=1894 /DNA_ORIENTATION=+
MIDSDDTWKEKFVDYYTKNAPSKLSMVNDSMMLKWKGKYEILMSKLVQKYGPLGSPINQPPRSSANSRSGKSKSKKTIADFSSTFIKLITEATPQTLLPRPDSINIIESKASNSENGLETSTFTVCSRVRPLLGHEITSGGECFAAAVPGQRKTDSTSASLVHTEELILHTPKISVMGKAKLESKSHLFDYTFGPDSTNQEIYDLACAPLVKRALNGQVGVIFAYGQTGSGKTHTMSGILEILSASDIFSELSDVSFSYIEILGRKIKDCLPSTTSDNCGGEETNDVQIGEGLNGAVLIRNMATHTVSDAAQLNIFIKRANATRATAATAKNDSSSRSHGVAMLKVKNKKTTVEGTLYIIDLAGSESSKDSKDHGKDRMKETKEINASLMVLKECIRARTNAARIGKGDTHVPFRQNKLTLLMKDVFDIGCSRLCSTVVIAACSPLACDIDHTAGTIKYASPLRVAVISSNNKQKKIEHDVHDPALWSNDGIIQWVQSTVSACVGSEKIDAKMFVNGLTGVQFCALPENDFYTRAETQLGDNEEIVEIAKRLYLGLWTLIVDAKTRKRRPDGSIITPEQEQEERRQLELAKVEKARIW